MNVVSLFSGAGGLDLGFILAGHTILWANDLFHDAVCTYRNNIGNHIVEEDIHNIPSENIPNCDIVIGGFPCQGFSVANTGRHADDERNVLYLQLLRVIHDKQPIFFLAENVKGILSLGHGQVFQNILNDFRNLNYQVQYRVLNAADYGIPQRRERIFIVGVRNDIDFKFEYPEPNHSKNDANGLPKWVSVKEAIQHFPNPDEPNNVPNHTYSKYKMIFNGYVGKRKLDPNMPSPTITARGDDKGGVVVHAHYNCQRRMTARELAAIQSFPDNFTFQGTNSSVYRQIGNAVPPLLAQQIANQFNQYEP